MRDASTEPRRSPVRRQSRATGTQHQKGKALSGVKHGVKNYSDSVYSG